jgi:hypothetical protein
MRSSQPRTRERALFLTVHAHEHPGLTLKMQENKVMLHPEADIRTMR